MHNIRLLSIIFSNSVIVYGVFMLGWNPVEIILFIWFELFCDFVFTSIKVKRSKVITDHFTFFGVTYSSRQKAVDTCIAMAFGFLMISLAQFVAYNIYNPELRGVLNYAFLVSLFVVFVINLINFFFQKNEQDAIRVSLNALLVKASILFIAQIYTVVFKLYSPMFPVDFSLARAYGSEVIILVIVKTIAESSSQFYRNIFFPGWKE